MKMGKPRSLRGVDVLVPRPLPQGEEIARLIRAHEGTAHVFPAIEICDPINFDDLDHCLTQLSQIDLAIFVSVAAVNGFVRRQQTLTVTLPTDLRIAVVGAKTAKFCELSGIHVDFVPANRFDSEGLIECMNGYDFSEKQIVIFRGQSGREFLQQALQNRGARISYIETYQRRLTTQSIQPIVEKWRGGAINTVLITSISILDALIELLDEVNISLLQRTPVITISVRIAEQCAAAGIENVFISENPSDHSMLEKMQLDARN